MIEHQLADSINRKKGSKEDFCEWGLTHEECYFCGQPRTVKFNEHYTFCPNCTAIYTTHVIITSNCKHIKANAPTAIREPWYRKCRNNKPFIYEEAGYPGVQHCSKCYKLCAADGW